MAKGLKREHSRTPPVDSISTPNHSSTPVSRSSIVSTDSGTRPIAGLKSCIPPDWKFRQNASTRKESKGSSLSSDSTTVIPPGSQIMRNHEIHPEAQTPVNSFLSKELMKSTKVHPSLMTSGLALISYAATSVATVFVNRRLFSSMFQYPLLVSWIAQTFGVLVFEALFLLRFISSSNILWISSVVGLFSSKESGSPFNKNVKTRTKFRHTNSPHTTFPPNCSQQSDIGLSRIPLSLTTALHLLPLSTSFVLMLISTNYCLKFVSISTYQVARSLTLVFNLIFSYLWVDAIISVHAVIAVAITTLGFAIGTMDRAILTMNGVVTGALGSLFQVL